jgi:hypothetical protein
MRFYEKYLDDAGKHIKYIADARIPPGADDQDSFPGYENFDEIGYIRESLDFVEGFKPAFVYLEGLTRIRFRGKDICCYRKKLSLFLERISASGAEVLFS